MSRPGKFDGEKKFGREKRMALNVYEDVTLTRRDCRDVPREKISKSVRRIRNTDRTCLRSSSFRTGFN
jgi:hypothetical protein